MIDTIKSYSDTYLYELINDRKHREAFDIIYDKYCDLLYGLILYSEHLEIYAEEILESVFRKILKSIYYLSEQLIDFKNYIIKTLIEVIINYLDSRQITYTIHRTHGLFKFELF